MQIGQRLDLAAFRRDPLHLVLHVWGVNLSSVAVRYGVGLYPETAPGQRLLTLAPTDTPGAEGTRFVEAYLRNGEWVSIVEVIASKASMSGLPFAGEPDADAILSHELGVDVLPIPDNLTSVETTFFFGNLTIKGSIND